MSPRKPTANRTRVPLTKGMVVATAISIADEQGVASLTMRKLAERLGVEAMSLYYHVANKEEILDAMVDAVFGEIMFSADGFARESGHGHAQAP